jgi:hypothetical protein
MKQRANKSLCAGAVNTESSKLSDQMISFAVQQLDMGARGCLLQRPISNCRYCCNCNNSAISVANMR